MNSGRVVIVAIAVLAIAAAGFSWWYRHQQGRRALAFWGAEAAYLIRLAPQVTLCELGSAPADRTAPTMEVDGKPLPVLAKRDISRAPGVTHARQALIQDASFAWGREPAETRWEFALQFSDGERSTTVLLDLTHGAIRRQDHPDVESLTITRGFQTFLDEQWTGTGPSPSAGEPARPVAR